MKQFGGALAGLDSIERLARRRSVIHDRGVSAKFFVTLLYVALVVSFPVTAVSGLVPFVLYPAIMLPLSDTPLKPLLPRLAVALPFAVAVGAGNVIMLRDAALAAGVVSFVSIVIKTILTVLAVLILAATTPFADIAALLTAAPLFRVVGLQIALTYRYVSTLLGEAGNMYTAYMLRSPRSKAIDIKNMGPFAGQLLLRSFDKADSVYNAMKCRGFSGVYHGASGNGKSVFRFTKTDAVFAAVSAAALVFMRFVNISELVGGVFVR